MGLTSRTARGSKIIGWLKSPLGSWRGKGYSGSFPNSYAVFMMCVTWTCRHTMQQPIFSYARSIAKMLTSSNATMLRLSTSQMTDPGFSAHSVQSPLFAIAKVSSKSWQFHKLYTRSSGGMSQRSHLCLLCKCSVSLLGLGWRSRRGQRWLSALLSAKHFMPQISAGSGAYSPKPRLHGEFLRQAAGPRFGLKSKTLDLFACFAGSCKDLYLEFS